MSARHRYTVAVDQEEYTRLLQNNNRLRTIENDLPEALNQIRRQSRNELQQHLAPLERRQQQYEAGLNRMASEVREYERQTAQSFERQNREFRERLESMAGELRSETHRLIAEQENRFNRTIEQERREREQQIQSVQQQVIALQADHVRKQEIAHVWLDSSKEILEFIRNNSRHERFAPGRLVQLESRLEQAHQNFQQGIPETALSQAQQSYSELSQLRLELDRLEREWQVWRSAALESVRVLLEEARVNRETKVNDAQGNEIDTAVEVDWWTDGKLSELENRLQALIAEMQKENSKLTTEDLKKIVEQQAPQLQEQLQKIVQEARIEVVSSQLRSNLANLIVQVLEEKGYSFQDATYEGNDQRQSVVAKVGYLDGSEVVVEVKPSDTGSGMNEININSLDYQQRTESELRKRSDELTEAVRANGLEVSKEPDRYIQPDPNLVNIEEIRKRPARRKRVMTEAQ
jgi:hypothetical protein